MTIKALRAAAGLTQKAFAELFNIPQRTIEDWEGGRRPPKEYLVRLIEYYLKGENYIKMEDIKMYKEILNIKTAAKTFGGRMKALEKATGGSYKELYEDEAAFERAVKDGFVKKSSNGFKVFADMR